VICRDLRCADQMPEEVKRNFAWFPEGFVFQLTFRDKHEVVANCDHLARLNFPKTLHYASP
jgi:hypothetical protein